MSADRSTSIVVAKPFSSGFRDELGRSAARALVLVVPGAVVAVAAGLVGAWAYRTIRARIEAYRARRAKAPPVPTEDIKVRVIEEGRHVAVVGGPPVGEPKAARKRSPQRRKRAGATRKATSAS
jgi:hypothetical protein